MPEAACARPDAIPSEVIASFFFDNRSIVPAPLPKRVQPSKPRTPKEVKTRIDDVGVDSPTFRAARASAQLHEQKAAARVEAEPVGWDPLTANKLVAKAPGKPGKKQKLAKAPKGHDKSARPGGRTVEQRRKFKLGLFGNREPASLPMRREAFKQALADGMGFLEPRLEDVFDAISIEPDALVIDHVRCQRMRALEILLNDLRQAAGAEQFELFNAGQSQANPLVQLASWVTALVITPPR